MRIKCPYCGERDADEFGYLGAAGLKRPDPGAADAGKAFYETRYNLLGKFNTHTHIHNLFRRTNDRVTSFDLASITK